MSISVTSVATTIVFLHSIYQSSGCKSYNKGLTYLLTYLLSPWWSRRCIQGAQGKVTNHDVPSQPILPARRSTARTFLQSSKTMIRGTLSRSRLRPISLDRLLGQPTAHVLNNPVNYEVWEVIQQRRQDLWRSPSETTRPVSDLGKFFRLGSEHNGSELFQFEVHSNQTIRFRPIRLIEVYMYMQSVVGMRIHNTRASKINNRNPKSKRTTYSMLLIRQKLKYN